MSAVATPARKAAPKAAVKAKSRSIPTGQGAGGDAKPEFLIQHAAAALVASLDAAANTDEPHHASGDSTRLLINAFGQAEKLQGWLHRDSAMTTDHLREAAFDIAALVKAAQRTPGDVQSEIRLAHIAKAALHLEHLAGTTEILKDWEPPTRKQPAPAKAQAVAQDAWEHVIGDVMCRHEIAQDLLKRFAEENHDQPGALGVLALTETLQARIANIRDSTPGLNDHLKGVFPDISADYLITIDVARAVNAQCEESLMWAAIYLMDDCKAIVDAHVDALTAAHASTAGKAGNP